MIKKKLMCEAHQEFRADKRDIPKLKDFLTNILRKWNVNEAKIHDIILASDEAATNIILHAYKEQNKKNSQKKFNLILRKNDNVVQVVLEDEGISFDISQVPQPDVSLNLAGKKRGGFGIYLMKMLMDKCSYRCNDGKNLTKLVKRI